MAADLAQLLSDPPGQDPSDELLSPGGQYRLRLVPMEMRMSHWVIRPLLQRCADGRQLFAFDDPAWSVDDAHWLDATRVELRLRRYPGDHLPTQLCVHIDARQHSGQIGAERVPWSQLEELARRSLRTVVPAGTVPAGTTTPARWRGWLRRLLRLG